MIAVFWGSLKAAEKVSSREPSTSSWRQIKENRKIEELILFFVTTATQALRKDPTLVGDAWKEELNTQISQFVLILRDCLRNVSHVPPEITSRLEMYTAKLTDVRAAETRSPSSGSRSSLYGSTTTGNGGFSGGSVDDMPLVKTVGHLFGRSDDELQKDVSAIKKFCTDKAALVDLKVTQFSYQCFPGLTLRQTCLKNINAEISWPGRREDFDTNEGYIQWRTQELAHLSQLMVMMVQLNPDLARSMPPDTTSSAAQATPRPTSMYDDSLAHSPSEDDEPEAGRTFTYIPPNPRKYYKRLLELCVQYDLEAMVHLPEDQEVSLGILSARHLEVLNECALRWRISHAYRVTAFVDVIRYKYEREEVPLECIPEGLQLVTKAIHDLEVEKWSKFDVRLPTNDTTSASLSRPSAV